MYVRRCFHYNNICEFVFGHILDVSRKTSDVDMVDKTVGKNKNKPTVGGKIGFRNDFLFPGALI